MVVRNGITRSEFERERYLDEMTERFYKRTGKRMSTDEVVKAIYMARRKYLPPPKPYWEQQEIRQRTYARYASLELIHRMDERPCDDPIRIIYELQDHLDDMIAQSDSRFVWEFAGAMVKAIDELLDLLK